MLASDIFYGNSKVRTLVEYCIPAGQGPRFSVTQAEFKFILQVLNLFSLQVLTWKTTESQSLLLVSS